MFKCPQCEQDWDDCGCNPAEDYEPFDPPATTTSPKPVEAAERQTYNGRPRAQSFS